MIFFKEKHSAKKGGLRKEYDRMMKYVSKFKKPINIVEEEAKFVRIAFQKFATSFYTIDTLHLEMVSLGIKINGVPIGRSTLGKILRNVFYIGKFTYNGQIYIGAHTPIIEKDLFYRVQRLLSRNESTSTPVKRDFIYSLMIKCWYDGHYFVGYIKKEKYIYWKCAYRNPKAECGHQNISEIALENQIEEIFNKIYVPEKSFGIKKIFVENAQRKMFLL